MKMSKKTLAKILTACVIAVILATICGNVMAVTNPGSISIADDSSFNSIGGKIIGAIQGIGSVVAVGILVVLGIKYMMGSAEEKAEYKKTMIPYIIGAVLIFGATTIANVVFQFAQGV